MKRRGFTLVEMLVVITIIGVLVALASVAVFKALETAKRSRLRMELVNIENAMSMYTQKYGDFPPSDLTAANKPAVVRWVAKAFPRCDASAEADAIISANLNAAQALVLWLHGPSKDVMHPFSDPNIQANSSPLFDFDTARLTAGVAPMYHPIDGAKAPYVYFHYKSYWTHLMSPLTLPGVGLVKPYMNDASGTGAIPTSQWDDNHNGKLDDSEKRHLFVNSNSFQLISAGLDGDYGTAPGQTMTFPGPSATLTVQGKLYPTGTGYSEEDNDNVTNFSDGQLADKKP